MVMEMEPPLLLSCTKRAARLFSRSPNLRGPRSEAAAAMAVQKAAGRSCAEEASGFRMKIVVSREELFRLMEALSSSSQESLEQVLSGASLRRRRVKRSECSAKARRWRPELQSIPEEC